MEPRSLGRSEAELISLGLEWHRAGERVLLATVAHTWGSSPRPAGAVMVLTESGKFAGSVSGGCIESELIERVKRDFPERFEQIEFSSDANRSLPCGGRLLLILEPYAQLTGVEELAAQLNNGIALVRRMNLRTAETSFDIAESDAVTRLAEDILEVLYAPPWRLLIIGAGELAYWVCQLARILDYEVLVCDPRPEYRNAWSLSDVLVADIYPDDFIAAHECDGRTGILALTHDAKVDDLAMLEAVRSPAFYVGALGSRRTTEKRAARLREHFALTESELARIHGPIGIDLATRRPQEIALAVLAEVTAAKNQVTISCERMPRHVR